MMELWRETILSTVITELSISFSVSEFEFLQRYEKLFGSYADLAALKGMLENSVKGDYQETIQRAKNLALGGEDPYRKKETMNPLCSVFSNLSLDGNYPKKKMYYAPAELSMENVIPRSIGQIKNCDYKKVREQFFHELDLLQQSFPNNFEDLLTVLDTLMKKYLWCIPATQNEQEDISLYDYIKTVMAITVTLLKSENRDKPYVMAAGHFSGIQKYIFLVSKVGSGGVAKRLRSRSFYVNAIISALAHCIVHKFGLPLTNILMLTGGKFYILLPNTDNTERILRETEETVTEFLYKKFKGNLSFELVWEKIGDTGIYNYSNTVTRLSAAIDRKKNQLLKTVLTQRGQWNPERFLVYDELFHKSMCTSCRSALVFCLHYN